MDIYYLGSGKLHFFVFFVQCKTKTINLTFKTKQTLYYLENNILFRLNLKFIL